MLMNLEQQNSIQLFNKHQGVFFERGSNVHINTNVKLM